MFLQIFLFELKLKLKQANFWVFTLMFLLLTFGAISTDSIKIGGSIGSVFKNSPFVITQMLTIMTVVGVFVINTFVANSIVRDFELETYSTFFTTPIKKFDYLFGRFSASFLVAFLVFVGCALGILIGSFMPWQEPERIAGFDFSYYVNTLFVFVLPNVFFMGSVFFTLATLTRSSLYSNIGVIVFFMAFVVSSVFLEDLDNQFLAALLDPFGIGAFTYATKYWTIIEKNTQNILPSGVVLLNRLFWTSVSLLTLVLAFFRFELAMPKIKTKRNRKNSHENGTLPVSLTIPKVSQNFSGWLSLSQLLTQVKIEFIGTVKSVPFLIMTIFGVLNFLIGSAFGNEFYGTPVYPVTKMMLKTVENNFFLFIFIILTFYSGELVWKERTLKVDKTYDAFPVPDWLPFASKILSLVLTVAFLLLVVTLSSVGFQTYKGYYNFEFELYLKTLFLKNLVTFTLISVFAFFVHVLFNNKFLGYAIVVLYFISEIVLEAMDYDHKLYQFAGTPQTIYSDINGYGHFVEPTVWFNVYWGFFAIILLVLAKVFWVRGTETGFRDRLKLAESRFTVASKSLFWLGLAGFFVTGSWIFYNTNILNDYKTEDDDNKTQAQYEKLYKKYEKLPQPKITDVNCSVDIFPKERNLRIKGFYLLKNKTETAVDCVHVLLNDALKINKLEFPQGELVLQDSLQGYYIFKLAQALQPQDTTKLEFDLSYVTKGFVTSRSNLQIVNNGTFFNNFQFFPHIGYTAENELHDKNERKKQGLPERARMPKVDDELARKETYLTNDSDWINFETIVSTSTDQVAIAPGYLQKEWVENERRYFHYKMDAPILNFYSFLSGNYQVYKDKWNDVNIEIFYNEKHSYNIEKMVKGIKGSLAYYTKNFSPYQHRQVRIIEFPAYAKFAQSFPNTIPYSESLGFIARLEDEKEIDYVFYVTAHEVAHQWWAHQTIGGNVQGSTVMSETMSQYSALMVMEKEYGKDKIKKFLKHELDRYLKGRGSELEEELPLLTCENQPYIHYNKGSLVMYALRDYVGEDSLNSALRSYLKATSFQNPPYTNSLEFFSYVEKAVPDSLKYLLGDLFQTITLFENKTTKAVCSKTADGRFLVKLEIETKKLRASEKGVETEIPIDDYVDIGILGENDKELYLLKHKINKQKIEFEIVVGELPKKAGIDPYVKLVDRNSDDNLKNVEENF
ncbi:ABC transporter permease subunit [bacterium]|nr:ABC transporter permease subunit [bacterium]